MKQITLIAIAFLTANLYGQNNVLNENFDNGIPTTWTIVNKDGLTVDPSVSDFSEAWISVLDPYDDTTANLCAGATSFFTTTGNANRWLISPAFSLADTGNVLTFRAASFDPSFPDNYTIKIGSDLNHLENFQTVITVLAETPEWTSHSLAFDTLGFNNQTVYIAFVLTSDNGNRLFIDDVSFDTNLNLSTNEIVAKAEDIHVYPNPVADYLFVEDDDASIKKIFNGIGQEILSTKSNPISVKELKNGIYFLQIEGKNKSISFIKR